MTIEIASNAPPKSRTTKHKYKFRLKPKPIIQTPNIATAPNNFGPTFPFNKLGIIDKKNIMINDPIPWAERKNPKASGPNFNTFSTKAGNNDSAPPKKTANISKLKTANIIGVPQINLNPCLIRINGDSVDSDSEVSAGFLAIIKIIIIEIHMIANAVIKAASIPNLAKITPPANGPKTEPIIKAEEEIGIAFV